MSDSGNKAVSFRSPPASWLVEVQQEIDRLAQLPAGWDSYGADAPDNAILSAARSVIGRIATINEGLPPPTVVAPSRSGGIQFEWGVHGRAYFELEFVSPSCVEYLFVDRSRGIEVEDAANIHDDGNFMAEVADYILRATHDR